MTFTSSFAEVRVAYKGVCTKNLSLAAQLVRQVFLRCGKTEHFVYTVIVTFCTNREIEENHLFYDKCENLNYRNTVSNMLKRCKMCFQTELHFQIDPLIHVIL